MRSLVYLQPMPYPTEQTHSIQITRTVAALGRHIEVLFVVGSLTVEPAHARQAAQQAYGVDLGLRVRVMAMPRSRLRGLRFPIALRRILAAAPPSADFYTRSFPVARRLLRWRRLHRRRVFLETHKKAGYLKEDPVPDSPYAPIRERFERTNLRRRLIRSVYARADCVFFLHRHSLDAARREQPLRDAAHLWYGLQPAPDSLDVERRGFVHCGSLAEHKVIDLLLDALDRVRAPLTVSLYGGDRARIEALRRAVRDRPCAARLDFRGWRGHAELQRELRAFAHGIALQEGMKVVDYLECGLTPIIPALPSYLEVLDARHAVFFRPDDADSLARALDAAGGRAADREAVRELCDRCSVDRRAATILGRLG